MSEDSSSLADSLVTPVSKAPPKGPRSWRLERTSEGLVNVQSRRAGKASKQLQAKENDRSILDTIKDEPYIFIADSYVPVLTSTRPHLEKRLKNYNFRSVTCDKTGYYIIFENGHEGKEEAVRCYEKCHMTDLFNYIMNMELCTDRNLDCRRRSASPERVEVKELGPGVGGSGPDRDIKGERRSHSEDVLKESGTVHHGQIDKHGEDRAFRGEIERATE